MWLLHKFRTCSFTDLLVKEIKAANIFVVLFDESLNKESFARGADGFTG